MLASCIFHNGYKALERENIGKITKFITRAKFSNCFIKLDNSKPKEPKKKAITNTADAGVK